MIDTHTHLCDTRFNNQREQIIADMLQDGLCAICETGADLISSQQAVKLAMQHDKIYAIVGTHPEDAEQLDNASLDYYRQVSTNPKVVAIGEIGLDYYYTQENKTQQKKAFESQLALSFEVGLPVVLHIRDAYQDALDILKSYRNQLVYGISLHCYSSSAEMVKEFSKLDCYFGLGGAITFKNANKNSVIQAIDKDRILLETDCPYMTPEPFRGKTNQPKYVEYVAQKIASVLDMSKQEVLEITDQNAKRLFKKINM